MKKKYGIESDPVLSKLYQQNYYAVKRASDAKSKVVNLPVYKRGSALQKKQAAKHFKLFSESRGLKPYISDSHVFEDTLVPPKSKRCRRRCKNIKIKETSSYASSETQMADQARKKMKINRAPHKLSRDTPGELSPTLRTLREKPQKRPVKIDVPSHLVPPLPKGTETSFQARGIPTPPPPVYPPPVYPSSPLLSPLLSPPLSVNSGDRFLSPVLPGVDATQFLERTSRQVVDTSTRTAENPMGKIGPLPPLEEDELLQSARDYLGLPSDLLTENREEQVSLAIESQDLSVLLNPDILVLPPFSHQCPTFPSPLADELNHLLTRSEEDSRWAPLTENAQPEAEDIVGQYLKL